MAASKKQKQRRDYDIPKRPFLLLCTRPQRKNYTYDMPKRQNHSFIYVYRKQNTSIYLAQEGACTKKRMQYRTSHLRDGGHDAEKHAVHFRMRHLQNAVQRFQHID